VKELTLRLNRSIHQACRDARPRDIGESHEHVAGPAVKSLLLILEKIDDGIDRHHAKA